MQACSYATPIPSATDPAARRSMRRTSRAAACRSRTSRRPPSSSRPASPRRPGATRGWCSRRTGPSRATPTPQQHHPRAGYRWAADVAVYIDPAWQGRGAGRRLYEALLDLLRRQGMRSACAGIALPNEASIGLHRALGFEHVGTYPDIGWKAGAWRDVSWWQLQLAPDAPRRRPAAGSARAAARCERRRRPLRRHRPRDAGRAGARRRCRRDGRRSRLGGRRRPPRGRRPRAVRAELVGRRRRRLSRGPRRDRGRAGLRGRHVRHVGDDRARRSATAAPLTSGAHVRRRPRRGRRLAGSGWRPPGRCPSCIGCSSTSPPRAGRGSASPTSPTSSRAGSPDSSWRRTRATR